MLNRNPKPVRVMVQDTGLDLQHPDIRGRLFTFAAPTPAPDAGGGGTIPRAGHGWDIIGQTNGCAPGAEAPDANPDDPVGCSGHGTAVAGVLGAAWNNGKLGAGVAPNARFVAMRSCWDGDQCYDHIQPAVAEWAGDHGVRVVTFSWLSGPNPAMTNAMRRSPRTLFVGIPSGNGGAFDADPTNPFPCTSNIPNIICVTTSAPNGGLDCGAYGRTSVDLAVPTRGMVTTRNGGGSFKAGCATSYASPMAGGIATILFGLFPTATPARVKLAMIRGARDVAAWNGNSVSGGIAHLPGAVRALRRIMAGAAKPRAGASAAPTDPNLGLAQPHNIMNVPEALDRADDYGRFPLTDVVVASPDTGLDLQHPDIAPRLYSLPAPVNAPKQYDFLPDVLLPAGAPGYDMIGNANGCVAGAEQPDTDPDDPVGCSGHGTAVAGTLGAAWDNGIGGAGIAPNARMIALRTCWDGDQCYGHVQPVAFDWAADRGARVVTMSWLGGNNDLRDEIAGDTDTLFVAIAGGNGGPNQIEPNARPCVDPPANIICVSTSSPTNGLDCGPVSATHVDVAVPSRNMTTTVNGGSFANTGCATSYAGPIAGGVATILFGAFPEATPAQVKQAMISSARAVGAWSGRSVSGGVVDACAAVDALAQGLGIARAAGDCGDSGPGPGPGARCLGEDATRVGTPVRDVINGTSRRDVIAGLGGNDTIRGAGGEDLICGNSGNDVLNGGNNADRISGGAGADRLLGGAGSDRLFGGIGRDFLDGLAGRDTCNGGPARDTSRNCQVLNAIP